MTKKNILLCISMLLTITSCSKNLTYSYLMQHPLELKKEFDRCQELSNRYDNNPQCEIVEKAAKDLYVILKVQQMDPEKFGQDILDAQIECAKKQEEVKKAQQTLADLKAKKASANAIKLAEYELETAQQSYENAQEKVKILLGVAGLNTPE